MKIITDKNIIEGISIIYSLVSVCLQWGLGWRRKRMTCKSWGGFCLFDQGNSGVVDSRLMKAILIYFSSHKNGTVLVRHVTFEKTDNTHMPFCFSVQILFFFCGKQIFSGTHSM